MFFTDIGPRELPAITYFRCYRGHNYINCVITDMLETAVFEKFFLAMKSSLQNGDPLVKMTASQYFNVLMARGSSKNAHITNTGNNRLERFDGNGLIVSQ
jgi:hypothetical protein